jgi:hypothetical protein
MNAPVSTQKHIVVFIDQEKFTLEDRDYTPRELLKLAKEDPAETTLVVKHGNELQKLTDLDKAFRPKDGEHFVVFHNSPTPVS